MKEQKIPFQLKTIEAPEPTIQEPTNQTIPEPEQANEPQTSNSTKKLVEEYLEEILMGKKQPFEGVKIHIKIQGSFTLLGTETTKDSLFEYKYPKDNIEEDEPAQPETPPPETEPEIKRLFKR
ncbi:MAG: hypothetical protein WC325_13815 [Candidatus Bathyarchaeia archaeon]|jgi:hypothetical protein